MTETVAYVLRHYLRFNRKGKILSRYITGERTAHYLVRFEVLTALSMKMFVLLGAAPCGHSPGRVSWPLGY